MSVESTALLRAERRADGKCTCCGQDSAPYSRCESCRLHYAQERKARLAARKYEGLCRDCKCARGGKRFDGSSRCESCRMRRRMAKAISRGAMSSPMRGVEIPKQEAT